MTPPLRFNRVWAPGISSISVSLFLCHFFLFFFFFIYLIHFFVSVSDVNELSLKEEDHLQDIVNYPAHIYPHLITPENLFRFNIGPDPGTFYVVMLL